MSWYLAQSLVQLRNECNRRWPNRSKVSDGSIGNAEHSSRDSDHNPDAKGCVHAIDVTNNGININELLREVIGDPRVSYVISMRRIYDRVNGFRAQAYHGANPHTHHVHISVRGTAQGERDVTPWFGNARPRPIGPTTPTPRPVPITPKGFLVTLGAAKENQIYGWIANTGKNVEILTGKINRTGTALGEHIKASSRGLSMLEDKINRTGNAVAALNTKLDEAIALLKAK